MKWEHNLNITGKALRETINDGGEDLESCKKTLLALLNCYWAIQRKVPEDDWYEFEEEQENAKELLEIFSEDEVLMNDHLLDRGYNEANLPLQATNESLRAFYDLCDYYKIWIGI